MSDFNASTSQLKAVKNMIDAWSSFNLGKVNALVSKNYKYEAFNGVSELATVDNKGRAEMTKAVLSGLTKLDVSTYIKYPTTENHLRSHRLISNPRSLTTK